MAQILSTLCKNFNRWECSSLKKCWIFDVGVTWGQSLDRIVCFWVFWLPLVNLNLKCSAEIPRIEPFLGPFMVIQASFYNFEWRWNRRNAFQGTFLCRFYSNSKNHKIYCLFLGSRTSFAQKSKFEFLCRSGYGSYMK